MYVDLEPEDVSQQYIDACVTGFLGVLAGTTLFGFGMSISLCYYNVYANSNSIALFIVRKSGYQA